MKKTNLKLNIRNSLFLIIILYSAFFILNSNQSVINKLKIEIQALFGREVKAQADITTGLVGHWKFDESSGTTASDSSGNNNNGTLSLGTSTPNWVTGKINNSLTFDGYDDKVNAGSAASLDDLGTMTISAWINPKSLGKNNYGRIVAKDSNVNNTGFWTLNLSSSNIIIFVKNYSTTNLVRKTSNNSFSLDSWQHITLTWDGTENASNVHTYVNGTETVYQSTVNGVGAKNSDASQNLHIGNTGSGTLTFDGSIDDVRVYNRVLTSAEVQELYNYTEAPITDTTPPVLSSGSPSGVLPSGTTQTTLSVSTNENATCKYGTIANTAYASITDTFTTTGGTSHSQIITGLINGTSYNYYVRCQDTTGNANTTDYTISFSVASPVVSDIQAPTIPTGLSATTISSTQINLSWNPSTDNVAVTGYKIYRCSGSACTPTTQIATSATNSYSNTGLTASTAYTYAVSAYDAAGNESGQSLLISATTNAETIISLDKYGGYANLPVGSATGFFRFAKTGDQYTLVTPEGNVYWFTGAALVSSGNPGKDPDTGLNYWDYVKNKYGSNVSALWPSEIKKRLLSWGFNGLGMYESGFVRAYPDIYRRQPVNPLMPHFNTRRFASDAMRFDKVKNLRWMLPNGGAFPDVFDPAFTTSASLSINKTVSDSLASEVNSPWVIGWITDESDDLNGISTNHTHPGWTALATAPSQSSGKYWAVSGEIFYTDTKSYTKYALQDFLKTRYGTIEILNTAWGSSYTTWESDGGYQLYSSVIPTGNGWLDENGKHAWMGKDMGIYGGGIRLLQGTTASFQKDLNDFETLMVQKYFKVVHDAIRSVDTNHLIVGPVVGAVDAHDEIHR